MAGPKLPSLMPGAGCELPQHQTTEERGEDSPGRKTRDLPGAHSTPSPQPRPGGAGRASRVRVPEAAGSPWTRVRLWMATGEQLPSGQRADSSMKGLCFALSCVLLKTWLMDC